MRRALAAAIVAMSPSLARAQGAPPSSPATPSPSSEPAFHGPISNVSEGDSRTATRANVTLAGYVEAFYQWNFNDPGNHITNDRGFDNRANTFTLANAVLDASWSLEAVTGRVALQVGHTGATYYANEPASNGTAYANGSDAGLWRYLQQANLGWRAPIENGLLIEAGLFLSPIGPEGMAVKDQWNWSRSNLFTALPFYHTGARATYPVTDAFSATLAVYNGWNSVVDNNDEKSISLQLTYSIPEKLLANVVYFGGVERPNDAIERFGPPGTGARGPFRHLLDAYVAVYPSDVVAFLAQGDGGFEVNSFGTSAWLGGALYGRVKTAKWLYVAGRVDRIGEHVPGNGIAFATPILFPRNVEWVESATLTIDARPQDNASFRVEIRKDVAGGDFYFKGTVQGDGSSASPYVPNASRQTTLTIGATTWF